MWVCYPRRFVDNIPFGLRLGEWYEVAEMVEVSKLPAAVLNVDGDLTRVPAQDLLYRESKPDYAFAYQVERMGPVEEHRLLRWMPVCPEGHQGPTKRNRPPADFNCTKCGELYEVRTEDSALIMRGGSEG